MNGNIVFGHTFYNDLLFEDALKVVNDFSSQNPGEIIILDITNDYDGANPIAGTNPPASTVTGILHSVLGT
jgi:imidazole glycerol phosphate synthase subunit HisF